MAKIATTFKNEYQKTIAKLIEQTVGKYSAWQIWQDFIALSAMMISFTVDGEHAEQRMKQFQQISEKYEQSELQILSDMFDTMVAALDENQQQDFLGELFMALGLGSEWKGQFFTPYSVCSFMAAMTVTDEAIEKINRKGWITASDPACGAGATLIGVADAIGKRDINYQQHVLFVAQDIDSLAAMMCYIQLSLLGCAGYVIIGDTLTKPGIQPENDVWYTPMYYSDLWQGRFRCARMDAILNDIQKPVDNTPDQLSLF